VCEVKQPRENRVNPAYTTMRKRGNNNISQKHSGNSNSSAANRLLQQIQAPRDSVLQPLDLREPISVASDSPDNHHSSSTAQLTAKNYRLAKELVRVGSCSLWMHFPCTHMVFFPLTISE
jgi:hypothetical protein